MRSTPLQRWLGSILFSGLLILGGCGGNVDGDGDGVTAKDGDCDDTNASINPGALEICDGIDQNCDGVADDGFDAITEVCDNVDNNCNGAVDEGFDVDGDGFTSCGGDCNDNNFNINPGVGEVSGDGLDNNCDGLVDPVIDTNPAVDDDGDCFCNTDPCNPASSANCPTIVGGDCDDTQAVVGPNAIEVQGDNVDNDCNGQVDEPLVPCDAGLAGSTNATDFAKAIGLCHNEVVSATFVSPNNFGTDRAIVSAFGTNAVANTLNRPVEGSSFIILSTGAADTAQHDGGTPKDGSQFAGDTTADCNSTPHPERNLSAPANGCGQADEADVCDQIELDLTLRVPQNANSFTFNFQFGSSEYPTFRCDLFDDTFLAELTSSSLQNVEQNISFDATGSVVSVNNGFFDICRDDIGNISGGPDNICNPNIDPAQAYLGTGFEVDGSATTNSSGAGGTVILKTTSPITPGELATLRFIIFDEGDDILDSQVSIDNFVWLTTAAAGPITEIP